MCRNIRVLSNFNPPATDDEIDAAALQYVRKVSGASRVSKRNQAAVDAAVAEIAAITRRLVRDQLLTFDPPRHREIEAEKAKKRGQDRERRLLAKLGVTQT